MSKLQISKNTNINYAKLPTISTSLPFASSTSTHNNHGTSPSSPLPSPSLPFPPPFRPSPSPHCPPHSKLTPPQADKLRTQQQLEQLQARYIGTGHADTTKHEWTSNIHRDSYASYIGHPPLLAYMAVGMGEPRERVRGMLVEVSGCDVGVGDGLLRVKEGAMKWR